MTALVWQGWNRAQAHSPDAAAALFYADWVQPIGAHLATLQAYRGRLLARTFFARCIDETRPYRSFFPLGAPDQD